MKKIKNIFYIIIPILILGIPFNFTTFLLASLTLLALLFLTNHHAVGIFFVMYGGPLGGIIRDMYPMLPVYGLLLEIFGICLLWDIVRDLLRNRLGSILGMVLVLLFFGIFYLLGPRDQFSTQKYIDMCIHGTMMLIGYYAIEHSSKIDIHGLTRIMLVAAVCMFSYCVVAARMIPGNLWDFNWFRNQSIYYYRFNDNVGTLVNYQHIGMMVLSAIAIFLSQIRFKVETMIFYVACAAYLVLVSGSRQAMLGVALVIAMRSVVFKTANTSRKDFVGRIMWISVALIGLGYLFLLFFQNLQSDVVSQTLSEGDETRMSFFAAAMAIFKQNLLTGAGLGGFHAITGSVYPHNMIFELLCETGLVGTIVSLLFLIVPLYQKRQGLLHVTASNQFYFLIVLGIFVRVMVSSDLTESIELFSAVFAITSPKYFGGRPGR